MMATCRSRSGRVCSCQKPMTWPSSCTTMPNLSQFLPMEMACGPPPRRPTYEQHLRRPSARPRAERGRPQGATKPRAPPARPLSDRRLWGALRPQARPPLGPRPHDPKENPVPHSCPPCGAPRPPNPPEHHLPHTPLPPAAPRRHPTEPCPTATPYGWRCDPRPDHPWLPVPVASKGEPLPHRRPRTTAPNPVRMGNPDPSTLGSPIPTTPKRNPCPTAAPHVGHPDPQTPPSITFPTPCCPPAAPG